MASSFEARGRLRQEDVDDTAGEGGSERRCEGERAGLDLSWCCCVCCGRQGSIDVLSDVVESPSSSVVIDIGGGYGPE